MRRKFNPYSLPPWAQQIRLVIIQVIIPITLFQGIRTLLFPTSLDVFLLAFLILIASALHLKWI